jgi:hypothetical protein
MQRDRQAAAPLATCSRRCRLVGGGSGRGDLQLWPMAPPRSPWAMSQVCVQVGGVCGVCGGAGRVDRGSTVWTGGRGGPGEVQGQRARASGAGAWLGCCGLLETGDSDLELARCKQLQGGDRERGISVSRGRLAPLEISATRSGFEYSAPSALPGVTIGHPGPAQGSFIDAGAHAGQNTPPLTPAPPGAHPRRRSRRPQGPRGGWRCRPSSLLGGKLAAGRRNRGAGSQVARAGPNAPFQHIPFFQR